MSGKINAVLAGNQYPVLTAQLLDGTEQCLIVFIPQIGHQYHQRPPLLTHQ